MNITILFLSYVFAGFVGFSAVALIVLVIRHRDIEKSQAKQAMCLFLVCSFLLGILYFVTDCLDTLKGGHPYSAAVRLTDMWLFILMGFFWLSIIRTSVIQEGKMPGSPMKVVIIPVIALLVVSVPEYVFFMDPYYYVAPGWQRTYSYAIEIILCLFYVIFDIIYIVKAFSVLKRKNTKIYLVVVTIAVMQTVYGTELLLYG